MNVRFSKGFSWLCEPVYCSLCLSPSPPQKKQKINNAYSEMQKKVQISLGFWIWATKGPHGVTRLWVTFTQADSMKSATRKNFLIFLIKKTCAFWRFLKPKTTFLYSVRPFSCPKGITLGKWSCLLTKPQFVNKIRIQPINENFSYEMVNISCSVS